jgi:predicted nucleic acid-binding protein
VAGSALLIDTDILIDYLKGIQPACALIDSAHFDLYYSSWTRKELLSKPGLKESERQEIGELLHRIRMLPVDDAIAEKYWILLKKYETQALRQSDAIIAATAWQKGFRS